MNLAVPMIATASAQPMPPTEELYPTGKVAQGTRLLLEGIYELPPAARKAAVKFVLESLLQRPKEAVADNGMPFRRAFRSKAAVFSARAIAAAVAYFILTMPLVSGLPDFGF